MLKHVSSEGQFHKKQKRKKNGVSTSSLLLDPVDALPSKLRLMRVLHTNVEDPHMVRQSTIPISRGHRGQGADARAVGQDVEVLEEDIIVTVPMLDSGSVRPKRKQGNDSVSYNLDSDSNTC